MSDAMTLARKGAAWLDLHASPGWVGRINLETLAINDGEYCILGQLYGDYFNARERMGITPEEAGELGLNTLEAHTVDLNEAWIKVITERRAPVAAPADKPRLELTREDVKLFAKRFRQIDNPDHSLESVELTIGGITVSLR